MAEMAEREFSELDEGEAQDEEQLVVFKVSGEEFGVDIMQVQEVIRLGEVIRIPGAPDFVEGIMDLRGKVLPVVDLRRRFGLSDGERSALPRVLVVAIGSTTVGLTVDAIVEVLRLPRRAIEPPPRLVAGVDAHYVRGIGRVDRRLVLLLDLDRLFSEQEMGALDEVGEQVAEGTA